MTEIKRDELHSDRAGIPGDASGNKNLVDASPAAIQLLIEKFKTKEGEGADLAFWLNFLTAYFSQPIQFPASLKFFYKSEKGNEFVMIDRAPLHEGKVIDLKIKSESVNRVIEGVWTNDAFTPLTKSPRLTHAEGPAGKSVRIYCHRLVFSEK